MSDFDTVLERLLVDPSFAAALAADPTAALAGYRLGPDEVALLHSQVSGDAGVQGAVETRANQSSVFGLLSPLGGLVGAGGSLGEAVPRQGFGAAPPEQGFGAVPPEQGFGPAAPGDVSGTASQGFGSAEESAGFGAADRPDEPGTTTEPRSAAGRGGLAGVADRVARGVARVPGSAADQPLEGYHTRVDADGDGTWDRHTVRGGARGVDILVDTDSDGRVDFVGHDRDADGLVDSAEYDEDGDGFFEKRSDDLDGDGLLDRSERLPRPPDRR